MTRLDQLESIVKDPSAVVRLFSSAILETGGSFRQFSEEFQDHDITMWPLPWADVDFLKKTISESENGNVTLVKLAGGGWSPEFHSALERERLLLCSSADRSRRLVKQIGEHSSLWLRNNGSRGLAYDLVVPIVSTWPADAQAALQRETSRENGQACDKRFREPRIESAERGVIRAWEKAVADLPVWEAPIAQSHAQARLVRYLHREMSQSMPKARELQAACQASTAFEDEVIIRNGATYAAFSLQPDGSCLATFDDSEHAKMLSLEEAQNYAKLQQAIKEKRAPIAAEKADCQRKIDRMLNGGDYDHFLLRPKLQVHGFRPSLADVSPVFATTLEHRPDYSRQH